MSRIHGILFDLDNTLVDRTASIHKYAQVFQRDFSPMLSLMSSAHIAERLIDADAGGYRGKPEMLDRICAWPEWKSSPDRQYIYRHWMWEFPPQAVPMTGMIETIASLIDRNIKLGLITNGSARAQNAKIVALHLWKYFSVILVSETAGMKKPDPKLFALALKELNLAPEDAWFVGDHPIVDIQGAERAGMTGIWRTGVHPWLEEYPEPALQIKELKDIIVLLDETKLSPR